MKKRTKRQLDRIHIWTHRRFHDATDPRFMRYWLAVRTKIIDLIVQESRTVSLDEWLQIWAAEKTARDLGLSFTWERQSGGLVFAMGHSNYGNDNQTTLSSEGRRDRG